MNVLTKIVLHGSEQSKRTGWAVWPGFSMAHFADGTHRYFPEGVDIDTILSVLTREGADVSACIPVPLPGYPPKPEAATEYQSGWSYEKPVSLGDWEWSSTFGRWGRHVTFANGWSGFTWPKTW